ncbi:hypothetical protein VCSRO161_1293 [Vibrio cholerae]|nr:hypothetical protein VCSRO161_1293 [Vibrio cholerae]GIA44583.1 hypothetical protein VCSRO180_1124 [Vibrio cholerae]
MNLYLSLDHSNISKIERTLSDILKRHQEFRNLCDGRNGVEVLYELLFPNNMPIAGYVSNRQRDKSNPKYAQMAVRINAAGKEWPFREGCVVVN